jgi:hypothetical protein
VDVAHTWDRAETKPVAYVLTNSGLTACFIVLGETASRWVKTERWDRAKQRKRAFYECPIELATFHVLPSRGAGEG